MVDPTSDLGEDVDESNAPVCTNCGELIIQSPTHRVLTSIEDGIVQYQHFCDDDCKADWADDQR